MIEYKKKYIKNTEICISILKKIELSFFTKRYSEIQNNKLDVKEELINIKKQILSLRSIESVTYHRSSLIISSFSVHSMSGFPSGDLAVLLAPFIFKSINSNLNSNNNEQKIIYLAQQKLYARDMIFPNGSQQRRNVIFIDDL